MGQVRLGMYLTGVECSWLRSPFWRARFLLTDPDDLAALCASGIEHVTIDPGKGVGLAPLPVGDVPAVASVPAEDIEPARRPAADSRTAADRAKATIELSKAAVAQLFGEARLGRTLDVAAVAPMVDEIAAAMLRDQSSILKLTRLKTRDDYTYMHSVAVCALMIGFGRRLGLDEAEVREVGLAGLLHDIGKMGVPEAVLAKPGKLDDDEFAMIRAHPEKGHALLVGCADVGDIALDVCLHHHEKMDGTGYPFGLTGDRLSLHARMGAICDVYDAVTSARPYKDPWSANEALGQMLAWEGHFDPDLLQAFVDSVGIPPRDALVRLHSNRLGVVLGEGDDPTMPLVRIFYDVADDRFLPIADVDTRSAADRDSIIREERWSHWFGEDWRDVLATVGRGETVRHDGHPAAWSHAGVAGGVR